MRNELGADGWVRHDMRRTMMMTRAKRALSLLLVAGMALATVPSGLWATSNVPEPGAFGIPINPNASGTKVSGPMSVAYDIVIDTSCDSQRRVLNMFVVVTLQQGNNVRPFNRALDPNLPGFCFPGDTRAQVEFFFGLIREEVIPHFFGCTPSTPNTPGNCPSFEVKAITDFLSSSNGAMSLNLTLAVQ